MCPGDSYNVILPTGGVMKHVLGSQIWKLYGCVPNIEQTADMNSYQLNASKEELIVELENKITAAANTYLATQGELCGQELGSKVGSGTGVELKSN